MSDDEKHKRDSQSPAAGQPEADPLDLLRGALDQAPDRDLERAKEKRLEKLRREIESRLPDLEVLELLGEGGMGTVWKVRQRKLDRIVALKVLSFQDEEVDQLAKRFEREAQALARLTHTNIVSIHDYGRDGSFCWLLMECVEGPTLRDLIGTGELTPAQALALVRPLCDGLQFAHDHGIVHRDVKPENVLIDAEGNPKIADFGLAKLLGEPAALVSLTATRQVLGTLRYMAPEQLDRPLEVDHRADIYALGVVLYEMLTGEIPHGRFALPSEKVHTVPRLDQIVLRTLEREPARRYQSAQAVKSDVDMIGTTPVRSSRAMPFLQLPRGLWPGVHYGAWLAPSLILAGFFAVPSIYGIAAVGLIAMMLGCLALSEIRQDWPEKRGLFGALSGVLFLPMSLLLLPLVAWLSEQGWSLESLVPDFDLAQNRALVFNIYRAVAMGAFPAVVLLIRRVLIKRLNAAKPSRSSPDKDGRAEGKRRLAAGAWIGPLLSQAGPLTLGLGILAMSFASPTTSQSMTGPESAPIQSPNILGSLMLVGLFPLSLGIACAIGLSTRSRIHQQWPQNWGLGGALFAAMLFPYLLGYGLTFGLFRLIWDINGTVPSWIDATLWAGLPISFVILLTLQRRRELAHLKQG